MQNKNKKRSKQIIASMFFSMISISTLSSSYVLAQETGQGSNYAFRSPVHFNSDEEQSQEEITVTAPSNITFNNDGTTTAGNADTGDVVYVSSSDGDLIGSGVVGENGEFSVSLSPSVEGGNELTYVAENSEGIRSETVSVTVPDDINVDLEEPYNLSFDETGESMSGDADPNVTVIIEDDEGTQIGEGQTDSNGDFTISLDPSVVSGDTVVLHSEDGNGNSSDDVLETVPEGIGKDYDECVINPSMGYTPPGECAWVNTEGDFLAMMVDDSLSSGNMTYMNFIQLIPNGPQTFQSAEDSCDNNQLNGLEYTLASQFDLTKMAHFKEQNNLEIFSVSDEDGWAWASNGKAVNIKTGEVADKSHSNQYDRYCKHVYEKFDW